MLIGLPKRHTQQNLGPGLGTVPHARDARDPASLPTLTQLISLISHSILHRSERFSYAEIRLLIPFPAVLISFYIDLHYFSQFRPDFLFHTSIARTLSLEGG